MVIFQVKKSNNFSESCLISTLRTCSDKDDLLVVSKNNELLEITNKLFVPDPFVTLSLFLCHLAPKIFSFETMFASGFGFLGRPGSCLMLGVEMAIKWFWKW